MLTPPFVREAGSPDDAQLLGGATQQARRRSRRRPLVQRGLPQRALRKPVRPWNVPPEGSGGNVRAAPVRRGQDRTIGTFMTDSAEFPARKRHGAGELSAVMWEFSV